MQIKVEDLSYVYSPKTPFEKVALDGVSFTVNEGDTIGIIGSTGSGKSTLCQHFNALIRITHGKIYVGDKDLTARKLDLLALRKEIGMLFQFPEYQLFDDTVAKDVEFGPKNFGYGKEEAARLAEEALVMVGMNYAEVKNKSPFELSGGEKRRAAIAGVIASKPSVLVLDEPTAGLDPIGKREILELVNDLKKSFLKTVIMISHNMDEIAANCNRVIVLHNGKLLYDTTPEQLFSDPEAIAATDLGYPHSVHIKRLLAERGIELDTPALDADSLLAALKRRYSL